MYKLQESNNSATMRSNQKEDHLVLKMYSVRDSKTEVFNSPFFNHTHGEAERNFRTLVNDEKSQPGMYPQDYDLYYLGEYDDQTGKLVPLDSPQHIIQAIHLVKKVQ